MLNQAELAAIGDAAVDALITKCAFDEVFPIDEIKDYIKDHAAEWFDIDDLFTTSEIKAWLSFCAADYGYVKE